MMVSRNVKTPLFILPRQWDLFWIKCLALFVNQFDQEVSNPYLWSNKRKHLGNSSRESLLPCIWNVGRSFRLKLLKIASVEITVLWYNIWQKKPSILNTFWVYFIFGFCSKRCKNYYVCWHFVIYKSVYFLNTL